MSLLFIFGAKLILSLWIYCTRTCDYDALDVWNLLILSVLMVYNFILQNTGFAPLCVSSLRNIYKILISSEEVLIYKWDANFQ